MAYRPLPDPVIVVPSGIGAELMRRWMITQGVEAFISRAPAESRAEAWRVFDAIRAAASQGAQAWLAPAERDEPTEVTMLTANEAGVMLGCSGRRVRQLLDERRIDGTKLHGRWMVPQNAVEDFQNSREAA